MRAHCPFPKRKELPSSSSVLWICIASFFNLVSKLSAEKRVFGYTYRAVSLVFSCLLDCSFFSLIQHYLSFHNMQASELLANDTK